MTDRSPAPDDDPAPSDAERSPLALAPDPALAYRRDDGDRIVIDANAAFVESFGDVESDDPLLDALPRGEGEDGGDDPRTLLARARSGDAQTIRLRDAAGTHRDFLVRVSETGDVGCVRYVDVTPLCEARRRAETRSDRLGQFAHSVAHELRNPLDVAMARLEVARETGENVHLEKIERAHERMVELVTDHLELAEAGLVVADPAPTDLEAVVAAAWEGVDAPDATLVVAENPGTVIADENRLRDVFENLFRNAVVHGRPDVTVRIDPIDGGFAVADDGPGVPAGDRSDVFEAGYTTSEDGTGLGLALVDRVAAGHGWEVTLTESERGGARFEFTGVETDATRD